MLELVKVMLIMIIMIIIVSMIIIMMKIIFSSAEIMREGMEPTSLDRF